MATTTQKYNKLNSTSETTEYTQLMYPIDLTGDSSYSPFVVIFEPNIIKGHKAPYTHSLVTSPDTISGSYGDEVAINIVSGVGAGGFRNAIENKGTPLYKKSNESIVLPMHNTINTTYSATWANVKLGIAGRAMDYLDNLANISNITLDKVANSAGNITRAGILGAISKLPGVGEAAKSAVEIATGTAENAYAEVLFEGIENRSHSFSWTFVPRSLKEARMVRSIIHRFKYHMLPEYNSNLAGNSYILHPSTFDISFIDLRTHSTNEWMHMIATCGLTQVSVNGSPQGEYSITKDGAFTSVTVDLIFKELVTLTKEDLVDVTRSY